jgi:cell wall-associated NlpC family hydrolase
LTASAGTTVLQVTPVEAATARTAATASTAQLSSAPATTVLTPASTARTSPAGVKTAVTVKTAKAKKLSKAAKQKIKAQKAVSTAKKKIGSPYRWGGAGPNAFDCSGLMQYAWRKAGVKLPRVTYSQYAATRKKVSWNQLRPGDLLFFRGKGHVGMYIGKGKMVHSPSTGKRVRIEKLSGWRKASFSGAVRPGI